MPQPIAPEMKNGLRRPPPVAPGLVAHRPDDGQDEQAQMGPGQIQDRQGAGIGVQEREMGFTAVCCMPKLYWTPKKPKFMYRICLLVISGLRLLAGARLSLSLAARAIAAPPIGPGSPTAAAPARTRA
jgi:hypothetical protein